MVTEFLIKYWDWLLLGFLLLNTIVQKLEKLKGSSDILTAIWAILVFILSFVKQGVTLLFSSKPGKLPMLFIGFLLMSFLLVGQVFAASDVTFEWDSNTEADMAYYNFYRSDDGQVTWNKVNPAPIIHTGMGTETWTDFGVPDGTYSYYATAVDTEELESERSNIVTGSFDTEAPAPPQNLLMTLIKKIIAWIIDLFKSFRFA